jgi:hypothetical protein
MIWFTFLKYLPGQIEWLMPVIPAIQEARDPQVAVLGQPEQNSETLSEK